MRWTVLLAVAGCNQVYGLGATELVDAAYFDAPADAPFECPAHGTAPVFSPLLHQELVSCEYYSEVTAGRAIARCRVNGTAFVFEGAVGEPLEPAVGVTAAGRAMQPRLSQDGQRMLVLVESVSTNPAVQQYARQADGSWARLADAPLPNVRTLGTLAAGSTGDRVLFTSQLGADVHEWVNEAGAWREARVHPYSQVGGSYFGISIAADGLRATASGDRAFYLDRAREDDPFGAPTPISGAPKSEQLFMTADCGRLYAPGLGSLFYVTRQ